MIDKNELLLWLAEKDKLLEKQITLVAVGGTAMTLLGLKSSTIDIDFCLAKKEKKLFEKVVNTYAGKEEDYKYHMEIIVKRFFSTKK